MLAGVVHRESNCKITRLQVALGRMETSTSHLEFGVYGTSATTPQPAQESDAEFQDFLHAFLQELSKFEKDCGERIGTEGRELAALEPKSQSLKQGREKESPMGRRDDSRPRFSRARIAKAVSTVASQTISA